MAEDIMPATLESDGYTIHVSLGVKGHTLAKKAWDRRDMSRFELETFDDFIKRKAVEFILADRATVVKTQSENETRDACAELEANQAIEQSDLDAETAVEFAAIMGGA